MITLQFCGGARSVTGGNYLVDNGRVKFLLECGMAQGSQEAEQSNYEPFAYEPSVIDFLIVTHAHIDHMGRVPKLVKDGFDAPIYSTPPTKDISRIALEDSVSVMKNEKTETPLLFDMEDVNASFDLWETVPYDEVVDINEDVSFRLRDAGHILGSSIVEVWVTDHDEERKKKIVLSGDMGNIPSVLLNQYAYIEQADYVLVESVYGDRIHEDNSERSLILKKALKDTIERQSTLLIPTFAIERTQDLIYEMNDLVTNNDGSGKRLGRVGEVDVYLDSPMGIEVTKVFRKYTQYLNESARKHAKNDEIFQFPFFTMTSSTEESMEINTAPNPKVIMAGAGMSTGGRILYHEERYLENPDNIILFVGHQVAGTTGYAIKEGDTPIYIHGSPVENNIEKRVIDGYSGHADQAMLLNWLAEFQTNPEKVFIVQGDKAASEALAHKARHVLGQKTCVPRPNELVSL
jgi:metallo-beta-lactamase family protein